MNNLQLNYGIAPIFEMTVGTGSINGIHNISENLYVSTSTEQIAVFDIENIQQTVDVGCECSCYIKEQELLVCITKNTHSFHLLLPSNIKNPVSEAVPTNQEKVYHILYSPKSNIFLTIGSGVSVWSFSFDSNLSKGNLQMAGFKISQTAHFLDDYNFQTLTQPLFDYANELLMIPTDSGIKSYKLDGSYYQTTTESLNEFTPISLNPFSFKFLTMNDEKLTIYQKNQSVFKCFKLQNEKFLTAFYFSKNDILFISSKQDFFLMNIKSGKFWRCYSAKQPISRIFFVSGTFPKIFRVSGSTIYCEQINIPWKIWELDLGPFKQLNRIPKINNAARIIALDNNNTIKFISPKNKALLAEFKPEIDTEIVKLFYDRGNQKNSRRDDIFILTSDRKLRVYDASSSPIKFKLNIEYEITSFTQFNNKSGDLQYIAGTVNGEILVLNYEDFSILNRNQVSTTPVVIKSLHFDGQFVIVITEDELLVYNVQNFSLVSKKKINTEGLIKMHNNILYIGRDNGKISRFELIKNILRETTISMHETNITSMSFGETFWVSTSIDGTVNYFNYVDTCLATINLENSIYSTEILNGKRDVILSTDTDLMIIKGEIVFGKEIDQEIPQLDNFNRIVDILASGMFRNSSICDATIRDAILVRNEKIERQITDESFKSIHQSPKSVKNSENEDEYINNDEPIEEIEVVGNEIQEPDNFPQEVITKRKRAPRRYSRDDISKEIQNKSKSKDKKLKSSKNLIKNKNQLASAVSPYQSLPEVPRVDDLIDPAIKSSVNSKNSATNDKNQPQNDKNQATKNAPKHPVAQPTGKVSNPKSIKRIKERIEDQKCRSQKEIQLSNSDINITIEKSNSLTSFESILVPPQESTDSLDSNSSSNPTSYNDNPQQGSIAQVYGKKKDNPFAFNERSLFQPLMLPNQNRSIIDPILYPDEYRKNFFEIDKGFSMNHKNYHTLLPPRIENNSEDNSISQPISEPKTAKDDSIIKYCVMKRFPTPPVIKPLNTTRRAR